MCILLFINLLILYYSESKQYKIRVLWQGNQHDVVPNLAALCSFPSIPSLFYL